LAQRHKSAIKRHRQSIKRRDRNRSIRTRVRSEIRKLRETVEGNDPAATEAQLRQTVRELNKAASKGVLHRNAAARRVSRLSKRAAAAKAQGA
jgi:small subunit ribosomal protein S20